MRKGSCRLGPSSRVSGLAILANCGLASPGQPIDRAASLSGSTPRAPGSAPVGRAFPGIIAIYQAEDQFKYESDHLDLCLPINAQKCICLKEELLIPDEIPEQYYDLNDNQMPYGGATDIHGKILWKVSKEEHDQMMARIKKAFEKE